MSVELPTTESGGSAHELASAWLVGLIAITVAVLVVLEVAVSHEGARADAESARLSSLATTQNNVSQGPFGFQVSKTLEAAKVAMEGTTRQIVALEAGDASRAGDRRGGPGRLRAPDRHRGRDGSDPRTRAARSIHTHVRRWRRRPTTFGRWWPSRTPPSTGRPPPRPAA